MNVFVDPNGCEWKLRLTVGALRDAKAQGVDLSKATATDAGWADLLAGDPEDLVKLLWVLCEAQAAARGVTPEAFGHLFDGATLEAAGVALAGAIADFFPRSAVARAVKAGLPKILAAADEQAVEEFNRRISIFCNSASSAPGSSALTPAG